MKKLTRKELSLKQNPWITFGITKSMKKRDQLYKDVLSEKDPDKKKSIFTKYKQYRNMIISLIRKSKRKFYINYFTEHNKNI